MFGRPRVSRDSRSRSQTAWRCLLYTDGPQKYAGQTASNEWPESSARESTSHLRNDVWGDLWKLSRRHGKAHGHRRIKVGITAATDDGCEQARHHRERQPLVITIQPAPSAFERLSKTPLTTPSPSKNSTSVPNILQASKVSGTKLSPPNRTSG